MSKLQIFLIILVLIFIPLYPKFPLVGVSGTFVAIRLEDILLLIVYGVWGIWAVKNRAWRNMTPTHKGIVVYWLIGLISVFSGIFLTKTAGLNLGLLHWFRRIEYMGLFFVGYSFLQNKNQIGFIVKTIVVTAIIVALYGLGQQYLGLPVISTNNSEFSKGLALTLGPGARINSTFAGHYDLAAFSILPLLVILGLFALYPKQRLFLAAAWVVVYWCILMSASRVTFVAVMATSALFLWIIRKRSWIVVLTVIGIIGVLLSPQLLGRYRELIVNNIKLSYISPVRAAVDEEVPDALKPSAVAEDRSLNIRLNASWPKALRSIYKNPLLGTGYSSVGLAVDNDYLRMLAETGILGLVSFTTILLGFIKLILIRSRTKVFDLSQTFQLAVWCGLVGLMLNAVFIDIFEASKIAISLWLLLGITSKLESLR